MRAGPVLAVVVVNYGSSRLLARNFDPDRLRAAGISVVVVDNYSSRVEREAIRQLCRDRGWTLVESAGNAGFGDGVNQGVEAAVARGADTFVAINPDARADVDVLWELGEAAHAEPRSLSAPMMVTSDGRNHFRGSTVNVRTGEIRPGWHRGDTDPIWKNWLSGACLAFSREAFDELRGFSVDYFLYWEDVDFSRRAATKGILLNLRRDLTIVHDEGGTQPLGRGPAKSNLYYFYNTRNRLLFGIRNGRGGAWKWLAATPGQSLRIWLRGGRRQILRRPGGAVAAACGTVAGLWLFFRARALAAHRAGWPRPGTRRSDVVLVAHPSSDLYGSDRVLMETVSALVESGRRVVVTMPQGGPLDEALRLRGAEVEFVPSPVLRKGYLSPIGLLRLGAHAVACLPAIVALIRRLRPALVLVNTVTIPLWIPIAKALRVTVICHVHEAEESASVVVRRLLYSPLLAADGLVVNSQYSLDVLAGAWSALARRARVVYNGVPGPGRVTPPRRQLVDVRLLFLGRLSPRKGPQVAVAALAALRERGVDARLSLLGAVFPGYEWFEAELIETVERRGLADRVDFLGFVTDVWAPLADADIVLVPSTVDEPFGNTAVEAMLAERPLVVSATSGLREAASGYRTARQVRPGDPEAVAAAVVELVQDWEHVIEGCAQDQALARRRHAPENYRATIRAVLAELDPSMRKEPAR